MSSVASMIGKLALLTLLFKSVAAQEEQENPCKSFGMDFQDGGSYFQNSLSTDDFSFVSWFEGCQNDTANNIFVDPTGDQVLCSDTNLQPDDTDQLATCPVDKNQLYSGDWSVIVISNNGDSGMPIAYQRDFSLEVAPQQTTTYVPTVTATVSLTAVSSVTAYMTSTTTITLSTSTTTTTKASKTL